jgi:anti-sigma regulatory factor (Ser/Thr protein kinase)
MNGTGTEGPEYAFEFDAAPIPPLARVRSWLGGVLSATSTETREDVELVTTELLSNAYEHAAGPFALRLARPRGKSLVRLEVDDTCPHLLPQSGRTALNEHRGRGLVIVKAISSDWGIRLRAGRKTIWVEIPIIHGC